jgi:dTDP-4-dehydrorhamnose 3,5-epimerase
MKFNSLSLSGAYIIEPEPFKDTRGKFSRLFCRKELEQITHQKEIVQINHSLTVQKGAIRGLHFQKPPKAEIRFVKCVRGSVFDVMIDLRHDSPTIFQWHGEVLSAENMKMSYIPEGFAHGFQTLEKNCELLYFHTALYSPENEGGVQFSDPKIRIKWPLKVNLISEKDKNLPLLTEDFEGIKI